MIPEQILAAAPESPWGFPPSLFRSHSHGDGADSPSRARAREAVPAGGSVLDVGCGGGAASVPLVPPAAHVVGVDALSEMLDAFTDAAARCGAQYQTVHGTWPDVAPLVEPADVVVCHHVFYNVADLAPFALALTAAARVRAVVELTGAHPQCTLAPLWKHFWDLDRPDGPTADDAVAVLRECGLEPEWEAWTRPPRAVETEHRRDLVAFTRRRLCLTPDRDREVDAAMGETPVFSPREVVTLWWPGQADPRSGSSSGRLP